MEEHRMCLSFLCRICGNHSVKRKPVHRPWAKETRTFCVAAYSKEIRESLFIVVNDDHPDVHPQRFCKTCHCRLRSFPKTVRGSFSSWMPKNDWKPHNFEGGCETCGLCSQIKKGGRPKKVRKGGRPGQARNIMTHNTHFAKLKLLLDADTVWGEKSSLDLDYFTIKNAERFLMCRMCGDVLMRPVETLCRHLFCLECVVPKFTQDKNKMKCPCCQQDVFFRELTVPQPYIMALIHELEVSCNHCKMMMPHAQSKMHACVIPGKSDHTYATKVLVRTIACNTTEKWPDPKERKPERYYIYRHKVPCVRPIGGQNAEGQDSNGQNTGSQHTPTQNNVSQNVPNTGSQNTRPIHNNEPRNVPNTGFQNTRPIPNNGSQNVPNMGFQNTPVQNNGTQNFPNAEWQNVAGQNTRVPDAGQQNARARKSQSRNPRRKKRKVQNSEEQHLREWAQNSEIERIQTNFGSPLFHH